MNKIDPDGREIIYSMTIEQKNAFLKQVTEFRNNSDYFETLFSSLESSGQKYEILFADQGGSDLKGFFRPDIKNGGGQITYSKKLYGTGVAIPVYVLGEELFHAYQSDNQNCYLPGNFNKEFEAKIFTTLFMNQLGVGFSDDNEQVGDFKMRLITNFYSDDDEHFLTPLTVMGSLFLDDYKSVANVFSNYYKEKSLGNAHYMVPTDVPPASLQKLIKDTFKK